MFCMNIIGVRMFFRLLERVRSLKCSMENHLINLYEEQVLSSMFVDDYGFVVSYFRFINVPILFLT